MPRLTQCADKYAKNAFVKHFENQENNYNLNHDSVASKVGISGRTVSNHLKEPDKISVGDLREYRKVLRLNPAIILELLGVTKKEAKEALLAFVRKEDILKILEAKE